ncbi:MAG: hypothetical protein IPM92_12050 [Saprospiraceae bacterium]|nr:hypothetical protein [Saprospiraceae bacterium]
MPTFTLKEIESIQGSIKFYDLVIDGVNQQEAFKESIKLNNQYMSEYKTILAYMDQLANLKTLPETKHRKLKGNKDTSTEYEFKSKHLRIYNYQHDGRGRVVVFWGLKTSQNQDLKTFRALKKSTIENLQ